MSNLEQQPAPGPEVAEVAVEVKVEEGEAKVERQPYLRDIGRQRMEKIGAFFSRAKEGFKNKARQAGAAISSAAVRAKELGIAGLETALAAPEAITRGVEYGVGAIEASYKKSREKVVAAKDSVVEAKNEVVKKGQGAIERGIQKVVDAKDSTIEFGNRALYRVAERISRPFLEYQKRRLSSTLRFMASRVERGMVSAGDLEKARQLMAHMEGLATI